MNPDLSSERIQATFDPRKLAAFVHGGEEGLNLRTRTRELYESIPELHESKPPVFMSREERTEHSIKKWVALKKLLSTYEGEFHNYYLESLVFARENQPFQLNDGVALPMLMAQGSDEFQEKWVPLFQNHALNGTYAQTELGHGTNLRKLETTATYDPNAQEFILNTPTITATKWWPGNLGKFVNYAIVMAQLWTQGKCYGPHGFLVQLRDLNSHQPMNGVQVGDIGPKFSFHANDNGYLILKNVRIPRENMLMKNAKVLPNGDFVPPAHSKLSYGSMVYVRSIILKLQAHFLAIAATISTRYSCVRRQGEITPGQGEVKVLDYQTQQYRVLPEMAKSFAYWFAGEAVMNSYYEVVQEMNSGNLDQLAQLHALSSGLKAVMTWGVAQGIEQCRLACGGHGYMHASGLPDLYGFAVGGCTYEGDNIVLLLQVARFLVKSGRSVLSGQQQSGLTAYLSKTASLRSQITESLEFHHLIGAFEHVGKRKVMDCVAELEKLEKAGYSPEKANNKHSVELCKAARAHVRVFLVKNFFDTVQKLPDKPARNVMLDVCLFFALHLLYNRVGQFVEDGYMSAQQVAFVRQGLYSTMALLRPNAVALSDSWDLADQELRSVLGRYDGQVYPNMLEWVKHSNLNKTEVLDSFKKYLAPAMKSARSKL